MATLESFVFTTIVVGLVCLQIYLIKEEIEGPYVQSFEVFCTCFFTTEVALKMYALSPKGFFIKPFRTHAATPDSHAPTPTTWKKVQHIQVRQLDTLCVVVTLIMVLRLVVLEHLRFSRCCYGLGDHRYVISGDHY